MKLMKGCRKYRGKEGKGGKGGGRMEVGEGQGEREEEGKWKKHCTLFVIACCKFLNLPFV